MINRAVVNSSPLIALFKSQQAELLPQLFTEILVPDAVWDEITAPGALYAAAVQLPSVSWARRVQVRAIAPEVATWDLGSGESAVLSQALLTLVIYFLGKYIKEFELLTNCLSGG